jgi:DNA polymerase-3 subunit epsilon
MNPWNDWRFAALDVETTGLSPMDGHEIVEIAVVGFGARGIDSRWSTLVKPSRPIPQDSAAVHGIRDADVASAPRMAEVLDEVDARTRGRILVLHNAPFDLEFVTSACFAAEREPIDRPLIDTLLISRRCFPAVQGHSLTEMAARLGIAPEGAHRALPDAVTTASCMIALIRRAESNRDMVLLEPEMIERIERHPALASGTPAT